jgi:hypothetical protein
MDAANADAAGLGTSYPNYDEDEGMCYDDSSDMVCG